MSGTGRRRPHASTGELLHLPVDGAVTTYPARVRHYAVLGTLVVTDEDGHPRRLGGPARRRLLAALLARAGRPVSTDLLIEDLWGDNPPATAETTLLSHVTRLRDDLGRDDVSVSPVRTEPGGYSIVVSDDELDSRCFERDLAAGRSALQSGQADAALALLDQALSWWHGEAYAEFPDAAFAIEERVRLAELRLNAAELRTDAALAAGLSDSLVAELETRLLHQPYRERSWEQLVVALYRSGRQVDALEACRRARNRLDEDLGLEPSPALRDLERRVLNHDPALAPVARVVQAFPTATPADAVEGSLALQPLLEPAAGPGSAAAAPENPYRGLASYGEEHADVFVGRERLTAELAGRLVDNDLLVVTGPSGAGKTSVVRAGLIPALRAGAIPGSSAWRVQVLTPGSDPAAALSGVHCDLLVVDQAEELFTVNDAEHRREASTLLGALLRDGTRLVLVLRGDFFGRLAELEALTRRIGAATVLVGPLTSDEARSIVTEPSSRRGVRAGTDLADRVVDDVAVRAGALPLLSEALAQAWDRRTGARLTLEDYLAVGGIGGAIETMAEAAIASLTPQERMAARRLLLRAATLTDGTWSRRAVPLSDAAPDGDPDARRAVDALVAHRIMTTTGTQVELAHEAVLSEWPRLRGWLEERAGVAAQLDKLELDADTWDGGGRSDGDVLRGPRLQFALDYRQAHPDDMSRRVSAFVEASREAADEQQHRERARRRRLLAVTAALAVVTLVTGTLAVVTDRAKALADSSAASADTSRLAAQSTEVPDETTALLLAAASYRREDSPDTRAALVAALDRDTGSLWRLPTTNRLLWVGAPRDGSRFLVMDNSRTVIVFDATTRREITRFGVPGDTVASISPDGAHLLVCGPSGEQGNGRAVVVDATTGVTEATLPTMASQNPAPACGAFTGDGRHLVLAALLPAAGVPAPDPGGQADGLAVYDVGQWDSPSRAVRTSGSVTAFATGDDTVAAQLADGTLQVRDAVTLAVLESARRSSLETDCTQVTCALALSPDGRRLVYTDPSQPRFPHALATSQLGGPPLVGDPMRREVVQYGFAPDGRRVAAVDMFGDVRVIDAGTLQPDSDHTGSPVQVNDLTWMPTRSGPQLLTVGLDSQVVSWDVGGVPRLVTLGPSVTRWSGDGGLFGPWIEGSAPDPTNPNASLLFRQDLHTGEVTTMPMVATPHETGQTCESSADGRRIAFTYTDDATGALHVIVYDMRTGKVALDRRWPPADNPFQTLSAGLDASGANLVVSTGRTTVEIVDVSTGTLVRTLHVQIPGSDGSQRWLYPLATDPFGRMTFVAWQHGHGALQPGQPPTVTPPRDQELIAVDLTTGAVTGPVDTGTLYPAIAWSDDHSRAVISTAAGLLRVIDARTLEPLTPLVPAANGYVNAATLSPDGSMVLSAGTDGTVAFWNATDLQRIGPPIQVSTDPVWAWYDRDGAVHGVIGDSRTSVATWFTVPGTPSAWLAQACRSAGRDLTQAEWHEFVSTGSYQTTCG